MLSLKANTCPTDIKQDGHKSVGIALSTTYKQTTTVFTPPAWLAKVAATTAVPDTDNDDFYIIESDDDPFANFAAVVFAAAEDHDFAYGVTTTTAAPAVPAATAATPVKTVPEMNSENSSLFRRRTEAAAAKKAAAETAATKAATEAAAAKAAAALGNSTPVIASAYKSGTSCLSLIKQILGNSPVKTAPTLNLANSRLFRRRAEALAAKAPLKMPTTPPTEES